MENSQHLPTFVERTITWSTSRASFENWSEILVWSLKNLLAHHNNLHVVLMKMEFKLRDLPPMRTNDQCNRWNIFHDMECGTCWQHLMTHKSVLLMPIKLFRKKKNQGIALRTYKISLLSIPRVKSHDLWNLQPSSQIEAVEANGGSCTWMPLLLHFGPKLGSSSDLEISIGAPE